MRVYLALLLCFVSLVAFASKKAITDAGDVVILNDDGTWHYEAEHSAEDIAIAMNEQKFAKDQAASFQVKSGNTDAAFWIDPKQWRFKRNNNGHESAEYTFTLKGGDLYAMAITEQIEIAVTDLADIAFNNARTAAPDIKVVKQEYRMVNGHKVIYMEMEGTIQSIKFTYLGYYYSDKSGSTQYLAYTGSNLVTKYRSDIDKFLNGFTTQL